DAMVVWMHERPLDRAKSYLLKHTTQTVRAEIEKVAFAVDLESLAELPAPGLGLNDIGRVSIRTHRPVFIDAYRDNRVTGAFILIDSLTNDTVAAGMILEASAARAEDARGAGARDRTAKREVRARGRGDRARDRRARAARRRPLTLPARGRREDRGEALHVAHAALAQLRFGLLRQRFPFACPEDLAVAQLRDRGVERHVERGEARRSLLVVGDGVIVARARVRDRAA